LRQELAATGASDIHVSTILPMAIDTPFFEHAANYTGHEALPIPPVYDTDDVVRTILNLVDDPKGEVIVGGAGKVMSAMHNVAAGLTEKIMRAETHVLQMDKSPPAPPTSGSIHEPKAESRA
jgi:short-subunit dehydrogenase